MLVFSGTVLVLVYFVLQLGGGNETATSKPIYPAQGNYIFAETKDEPSDRETDLESVSIRKNAQVIQLFNDLRHSEKLRCKPIATVETDKLSYIKLLITAPDPIEVEGFRKRLQDITDAYPFAKNEQEIAGIKKEVEDFLSPGVNPTSGESYKVRVLNIDLPNDTSSNPVGSVMRALEVNYGVSSDNGVPWMQTFGSSSMNSISSVILTQRYGHLFAISETGETEKK